MKKTCELGFHYFEVPLEDYDKPFWLASYSCARCKMTKLEYEYQLGKNGDDFRVKYEKRMLKIKNLTVSFVLFCVFVLFCALILKVT